MDAETNGVRRPAIWLWALMLVGAMSACGYGVPDDGGDGGGDRLQLGRTMEGGSSFEAYATATAEIELVHGFQGGYHVEPALYVTGVGESAPDTSIDYLVERAGSGEQLSRDTSYDIGPRGWTEYEDGYLHRSNPVIFDIEQPDEVVGDPVTLEVTVDIVDGAELTRTVEGTIVDEDGE